jgi:hypothetical protein
MPLKSSAILAEFLSLKQMVQGLTWSLPGFYEEKSANAIRITGTRNDGFTAEEEGGLLRIDEMSMMQSCPMKGPKQ